MTILTDKARLGRASALAARPTPATAHSRDRWENHPGKLTFVSCRARAPEEVAPFDIVAARPAPGASRGGRLAPIWRAWENANFLGGLWPADGARVH